MPATASVDILPMPDPLTRAEIMDTRDFHAGACAIAYGATGTARPDVTVENWRRNGATQTWKRDPGRFRIPVKHGLYGYGAIGPDNADTVHPADRCPILALREAWFEDAEHRASNPARTRADDVWCNHPAGTHRPARLAR